MRPLVSLLASLISLAATQPACGPLFGDEMCPIVGTSTMSITGSISLPSSSDPLTPSTVGAACSSTGCPEGMTILMSDNGDAVASLSIQGFTGTSPHALSALDACVQTCPGCAGEAFASYPHSSGDGGTVPPSLCVPVEGTITLATSTTTSPARGPYTSVTDTSTTVTVTIVPSTASAVSGNVVVTTSTSTYEATTSVIGGCPPPPGG